MTRRVPAYLLAVLLAVLTVVGAAGPASAHATLVSTDPAEGAVLDEAPSQVRFTFDEPVQLVPNGLLAFDAKGRRVDVAPSAHGVEVTGRLPGELADGTYVVTWRVVSADGHPIAGSLTFHVGAPSPRVVPPETGPADPGAVPTVQGIVHGLDYAALLLAGGLAVFLAWTARGVRLPDEVRRRVVRLLRASALAAVLAAALAVPLAGAYQLGSGLGELLDPASFDPGLVQDDLVVLVLQAAGLGVAVGAAGRARSSLAVDLVTALAVWSPALVGHTRAYEPSTLLVVTDALHLSAGAVWLGGLTGLALTLPAVAGRPRDAAQLIARFSAVAAGLLVALAVTGVLMGWRIVGAWTPLVEETWGRLLLVKFALVLVVVALAAHNRFRLVPRVAGDGGHEQRRLAAGLVRRTVVAEAVVLVAVLGVTGFLTQKPPTGAAPGAPQTVDTGVVTGVASDDLKVLAVLDPGPGLQRTLIVQVQNLAGDPLDLAAAPAVALRSDSVDLGTVPVAPSSAGTYTAEVVFPHAGTWQLQVSIRVDTFTSPVTTVELRVR
ncbi:copper resistance CopC/CopD family protein [Nocardioides daeguensis]|uniref:Copper resistance protein CopC n=1 Tax=Nocardioides daeguensis TaxID=908359 RepID=A0ABP6WL34_9ACTN|nr:copper resistance protein CopC [Nocardioides daeguensis]MBV6729063.1 copper resistance protein CopC [Nocardioides daeguensis]MCR1774933.1 copper resistance protein CopC [Nocardioides daeguensis]